MRHPYQMLPSGDTPGFQGLDFYASILVRNHLYNHLWATAQQEEKTPQRVKKGLYRV